MIYPMIKQMIQAIIHCEISTKIKTHASQVESVRTTHILIRAIDTETKSYADRILQRNKFKFIVSTFFLLFCFFCIKKKFIFDAKCSASRHACDKAKPWISAVAGASDCKLFHVKFSKQYKEKLFLIT